MNGTRDDVGRTRLVAILSDDDRKGKQIAIDCGPDQLSFHTQEHGKENAQVQDFVDKLQKGGDDEAAAKEQHRLGRGSREMLQRAQISIGAPVEPHVEPHQEITSFRRL